jgi:hypothetical protein
MATDSEALWGQIDGMSRDKIIALLEDRDDEVERLTAYIDHLTATVIEKAPQLLSDINSANAKVLFALFYMYNFLQSSMESSISSRRSKRASLRQPNRPR